MAVEAGIELHGLRPLFITVGEDAVEYWQGHALRCQGELVEAYRTMAIAIRYMHWHHCQTGGSAGEADGSLGLGPKRAKPSTQC